MKKATRNTFNKGLNKDINKHQAQNEFMYENENFRIITQEGQSNLIIENVKGNIELRDNLDNQLSPEVGFNIIGHHVFDNKDIVLFATSEEIGINDLPIKSRIYLYKYDTNAYLPRILLYEDNHNDSDIGWIGLELKNNIDCLGRVETNFVRKIYWTDNTNSVRQINITPDIDQISGLPKEGNISSDYLNIRNQETWEFDLVGKLKNTPLYFLNYGKGKLPYGKIQYAVRYINKNGLSSNYQIDNKMIPVMDELQENTSWITGGEVNKISNKSIRIKLNVYQNNKYDYIEVYSIHHINIENPTVKLIQKYELNNEEFLTIRDTGEYIDEISIDELNYIKSNYIAKTLERKDDRLFIGNITETNFDVDYDARAFRFNNNMEGLILDDNGNEELTMYGPTPTYPTDKSLDAINPYNNLTGNLPRPEYKYKKDGGELGGSGPNIEYTFINHPYLIDQNNEDGYYNTNWTDVDKYRFLGIERGLQREEIYRFGIVFINDIGQKSFTKWIGDIRMPDVGDFPIITTDSNNAIFANNLYVHFNVYDIPTNKDGTPMDYQIMYVPHTQSDKTILATGYSTNLHKLDIYSYGNVLPDTRMSLFKHALLDTGDDYPDEKLLEFISADIDLNNYDLENTYLQFQSAYLETATYKNIYRTQDGYANRLLSRTAKMLPAYNVSSDNLFMTIQQTNRLSTNEDFKPGVGSMFKIDEKHTTLPKRRRGFYAPKLYNIGEYNVVPLTNTYPSITNVLDFEGRYISSFNDENGNVNKTSLSNMISPFVIKLDNVIGQTPMYSYIRKKIIPYHGHSYESRQSNIYQPVSIHKNNSITNNGDTYVGFYDRTRFNLARNYADVQRVGKNYAWGSILWKHMPCMLLGTVNNDKEAQSQSYTEAVFLPMETNIILPLMHGFKMNKSFEDVSSRLVTDTNNRYEITEEIIVDSGGIDVKSWVTEVVDYPDMFLYNSTYSKLSDLNKTVVKPQFWQSLVHFPTRIRYSDIKFNGETHDSWTEFKPNNMQDVDTKYGELEQLINWKNYLFAFQHRGFCMLPVNERASTTTTEGSPVVLGEGVVLPKVLNYATGSEKYGLQNNNKVITSENGIYWLDVIEKKVLQYSGKTKDLNFVTGMSSWFRDNINETIQYYGGYDNDYKEVLFSLPTKTLVFSELINSFQGFYTFVTDRFIEVPELISVENKKLLWQHNIGTRVEWYGILNVSLIELIVTDDSLMTKEFNNIEYMSESFTEIDKIDNYQDTFNIIKSSNDFLESEDVILLPYLRGDTLYTGGLNIPVTAPSTIKNIRRRERMWRTTIPRVNTNNQIIDNYRMRDGYVKLKMIYNNTNGFQFISHPITTYYTMSNVE